MKVVCYTRVSTSEQADHGVSLAAQEAKLKAYAALYDLEIVAFLEDAGVSGKTLDRAGLQAALAMLNAGQAEGLLIASLSRLTRSVRDWQNLIDGYFCERKGKQLLSVADHIDTRSASGRMILGILMVVSQAERELISERTSMALAHKINNRQRVGKVKFGYDLAADGRTLVENAAEQETIALIHQLRTAGSTLQGIAKELSSRGIRTKEGNSTWVHTAVRRILTRQPLAA
jgi:site-specific DNA recombinase